MINHYLNHFFGDNNSNKGKKPKPGKFNDNSSKIDNTLNSLGLPIGTRIIDLDNIPDDLPQPIKSVFTKLKAMRIAGKFDDLDPEELDKVITNEFNTILGDPTEEQTTKKDGVTIDQKIWDVTNNEKVGMASKKKNTPSVRDLTAINYELEIAIENEEYEKAAILQNEINTLKASQNQANKKKSENK